MRPARIHRDITRDGTGQLARRVRRVKEAILFDRACDAQVGPSGLHLDDAVGVIGFDHVIHAGHAKDHAVGRGQRPTRQRRARAARHHRHAFLVADAQHVRHLLRCIGQHRHHRGAFIGGQRVTFIGARLAFVGNHGIIRQNLTQPFNDTRLAGDHTLTGNRHFHVAPPIW